MYASTSCSCAECGQNWFCARGKCGKSCGKCFSAHKEIKAWFHDGEILRAKSCLRNMDGCTRVILSEFTHFFRFALLNWLLLTGEAKFFLAKPNLSLLRMHDFISCEMVRISPRKSACGMRPWLKYHRTCKENASSSNTTRKSCCFK